MQTLGEKIKFLRTKHKMTQSELGNRLGVGKSAVAKYENNRTTNLKRDIILSLCDIFKVDASFFYESKEEDKNNYDFISLIIKRIFDEKGMSLNQLSKVSGIAPSSIRALLYDSNNAPINDLIDLCKYFEISSEFLFMLSMNFHGQDIGSLSKDLVQAIINYLKISYKSKDIKDLKEMDFKLLMNPLPYEDQVELYDKFFVLISLKYDELKKSMSEEVFNFLLGQSQ